MNLVAIAVGASIVSMILMCVILAHVMDAMDMVRDLTEAFEDMRVGIENANRIAEVIGEQNGGGDES